MGKEILKTKIKREGGKLYYCKSSEDGYLVVCEAILNRGGIKKEDRGKNNN